MSKDGQDTIYTMITERIVKALEAGTVPWRQPWTVNLPMSMSTNKPYRGINPFLLAMSQADGGYTSPWWGSAKRINGLGGKILAGQHGTIVVFWKRLRIAETDKATGEKAVKVIPLLRYYKVFNADQTEELPAKYHAASNTDHEVIDSAEVVIKRYLGDGPEFTHNGSRAFYAIDADLISVPEMGQHHSPDEYYSTVFHEVTHSTGHPKRLNIPESGHNHFGDAKYSAEELRAEMGAAMLCGVTGITATFDNSAAYLASWLRVLKADNRMVVKAAARAQKAADLVLGITYEDNED